MVDSEIMRRYKDWAPTQFDPKGLNADRGDVDLSEWFVMGVMRTRDSGILEQSNFEAALKTLGGESDDVQVHNFGHWGPGWFEIILINPERDDLVKKAEEFLCALSEYPVADDDDFSRREYEATIENIKSEGGRITSRDLPEDWAGQVFTWLWRNEQSEVESRDDGGGYPSEEAIKEALINLNLIPNVAIYVGELYLTYDRSTNTLSAEELTADIIDYESMVDMTDLYAVTILRKIDGCEQAETYILQSDAASTALDTVSNYLNGQYYKAKDPVFLSARS